MLDAPGLKGEHRRPHAAAACAAEDADFVLRTVVDILPIEHTVLKARIVPDGDQGQGTAHAGTEAVLLSDPAVGEADAKDSAVPADQRGVVVEKQPAARLQPQQAGGEPQPGEHILRQAFGQGTDKKLRLFPAPAAEQTAARAEEIRARRGAEQFFSADDPCFHRDSQNRQNAAPPTLP